MTPRATVLQVKPAGGGEREHGEDGRGPGQVGRKSKVQMGDGRGGRGRARFVNNVSAGIPGCRRASRNLLGSAEVASTLSRGSQLRSSGDNQQANLPETLS